MNIYFKYKIIILKFWFYILNKIKKNETHITLHLLSHIPVIIFLHFLPTFHLTFPLSFSFHGKISLIFMHSLFHLWNPITTNLHERRYSSECIQTSKCYIYIHKNLWSYNFWIKILSHAQSKCEPYHRQHISNESKKEWDVNQRKQVPEYFL